MKILLTIDGKEYPAEISDGIYGDEFHTAQPISDTSRLLRPLDDTPPFYWTLISEVMTNCNEMTIKKLP